MCDPLVVLCGLLHHVCLVIMLLQEIAVYHVSGSFLNRRYCGSEVVRRTRKRTLTAATPSSPQATLTGREFFLRLWLRVRLGDDCWQHGG